MRLGFLRPFARPLVGIPALLLLVLLLVELWCFFPPQPWTRWEIDPSATNLTLSADGQTLAALIPDGAIIYDLPSGTQKGNLTRITRIVGSRPTSNPSAMVILSSDGQKAVYQGESWSSPLQLWNAAWREPLILPDAALFQDSDALAFSPDSRTLLTRGLAGGQHKLWDAENGKELPVPWDQNWWVWKLTPIKNGQLLALDHARSVTVWNRATWTLELRVDEPDTIDFIFSADGSRMVAAGVGQSHVWDLNRKERIGSFGNLDTPIIPQALNRDGSKMIAEVAEDIPRTALFDLTSLPPRELQGWLDEKSGSLRWKHASKFTFNADGRHLHETDPLSWLRDPLSVPPPGLIEERIHIWDANTLADRPIFCAHPQIGPNGKILLGTVSNHPPTWLDKILRRQLPPYILKVWDVSSREQIAAYEIDWHQYRSAPDSQSLIIWTTDNHIEVWDLPPRQPKWVRYGIPLLLIAIIAFAVVFWVRAWRNELPGSRSSSGRI